jgi:hypothetical protein
MLRERCRPLAWPLYLPRIVSFEEYEVSDTGFRNRLTFFEP